MHCEVCFKEIDEFGWVVSKTQQDGYVSLMHPDCWDGRGNE